MSGNHDANGNGNGHGWHWTYWLLIIVCIVTFCVPFYNTIEPTLFGFPFFYWFQLAWIFVSMVVTAYAYFATEQSDKTR